MLTLDLVLALCCAVARGHAAAAQAAPSRAGTAGTWGTKDVLGVRAQAVAAAQQAEAIHFDASQARASVPPPPSPLPRDMWQAALAQDGSLAKKRRVAPR